MPRGYACGGCATALSGTPTSARTQSKGRVTVVNPYWRTVMRRHLLVLFLVLAGSGPALRADEARVPIFQSFTTISQPGQYILTRDLDLALLGNGVPIHANNVDLDLNGHSISSTAASNLIWIDDGFRNITIHDGKLSGGAYGIRYQSPNATLPTDI